MALEQISIKFSKNSVASICWDQWNFYSSKMTRTGERVLRSNTSTKCKNKLT